MVSLLKSIRKAKINVQLRLGGFLNQVEKFYRFKFSHLLFSATEQVSLTLQGVDTTIQEAVQASKLALKYLERQRKDDSFL